MMRSLSKRIAVGAAFTAVGLLLGYIESFFVLPVHVPGIRIGLANIVSVISLFCFGAPFAATVMILRVLLSALLFGSPVSLLYSLSGAAVALGGMILTKRLGFSVYGVSVSGAVLHNTAQICIASFLVGSRYVLYYIPALVIAGVVAGIITGSVARIIMDRINKIINRYESEGTI